MSSSPSPPPVAVPPPQPPAAAPSPPPKPSAPPASPPANATAPPAPAPSSPPPVSPPPLPPPPTSPPPATPPVSSPPPPVLAPSGSQPPPAIAPTGSPPSPPPPPPAAGGSPPVIPSPPPAAGGSPPVIPSPPSGKSPPSSVSNPPPQTPSPSSSSSVSVPAVVGIAVGAVVIIAFVIGFLVCWRRKTRRSHALTGYYGGPPPPPPPPMKDDPYGGRFQNWQHNAPPPGDNLVKIPPQPPPPPPFASRPPHSPAWYSPTPPPPPAMSSSGGSGSNYSGSQNPLPPPPPNYVLGFSKNTFTYEQLAMATDGFSEANLLGQGGFGYVHKGVLLNGKEVAIKQLKAGSGQGEREFQAEVEIISRVHHRHLVTLVGYCIYGEQRLLVYEYVPNKTLEFHLHGKNLPTMDWSTRLKIAVGSAKGLAYLHEDCHPKIIHRDIKAANILLDFKFQAKVADFGLAKFASDNNTHVSTRVMGTFGYMAPEYANSGKLTDKSDVYSFGVMLLELLTRRRPFDPSHAFMDESLVDWARPLLTRALEDANYDALIDPNLGNNYNHNEVATIIACAAACVRHSAKRRPRMSQIVRALEGDVSLEDLNEGVRPGHSLLHGSYGSSDYDNVLYNEDMKKFKKLVLSSEEYPSTEISQPSSEYGQNPSGSSSEGQQAREMEMGTMKKDEYGQNPSGSSSEGQQAREMEMGTMKKDSEGFSSSK